MHHTVPMLLFGFYPLPPRARFCSIKGAICVLPIPPPPQCRLQHLHHAVLLVLFVFYPLLPQAGLSICIIQYQRCYLCCTPSPLVQYYWFYLCSTLSFLLHPFVFASYSSNTAICVLVSFHLRSLLRSYWWTAKALFILCWFSR